MKEVDMKKRKQKLVLQCEIIVRIIQLIALKNQRYHELLFKKDWKKTNKSTNKLLKYKTVKKIFCNKVGKNEF